MAGILANLGNLFANPNFQQALFGMGKAMNQKSYQESIGERIAAEQNRILQNGGSYLDAQRAGAFIEANNQYAPSITETMGTGLMGYQQQQQAANANAQLMRMMLGDQGGGKQIMGKPTRIVFEEDEPDTDFKKSWRWEKTKVRDGVSNPIKSESLEAQPRNTRFGNARNIGADFYGNALGGP